MQQVGTLPTFIVIGAMKGGTTSLYHYLGHHPEVSVSRIKETDYFLGRHEYDRGLGWYTSLFEENAVAIGEASPNYTKRHMWSGVPERIARVLPDVRLIYVVRDPVERLVSHYVHNYAKGRVSRPISEVATPDSNYVLSSMYAYQLDAYLDHFSKEQILVVDSSDLRDRTVEAMAQIFAFLGVRDYEVPDERHHVSARKMRSSVLEQYVAHPRLRRALRPLLPDRLSEPQPFERPDLSAEARRRLASALGPDIERFRSMTGMSFEQWSV